MATITREELAAELEFLARLLRDQRPRCGETQAEHDRDVRGAVVERLAVLASGLQGEG